MRSTRVLLLMALLASAGCGSKQNAQPQCDDDGMCPADGVCMMGQCLPRGGERTVAIDIVPKLDSSSMRTSLPRVTLSTDRLELSADQRAIITGTVLGAPDARLVLTMPSQIPGLGDLQLETALTGTRFELGIGESLLRFTATLWITPTATALAQPPTHFQTMLNTTLGLAFPTTAEMTPIRGTLLDSLSTPQSGYLARALVGSRVISNVAPTGSAGEFQLLIAPGSLPEVAKSVTIEFTPPEGVDAPRFLTVPLDPNGSGMDKPTVFHLPPFGPPAPIRFRVQGMSTGTQGPVPLSGVSMRFRTQLLDNKAEGTGSFDREVLTLNGEAEVSLIPGTAAGRKYEIAIVPPPSSEYSARCVPDHSVTIVGNVGGQTPYSATFDLELKPLLTGTVVGDDGKPARNVNVRATFIQGNTLCTNVASSATASAATNVDGSYKLFLDPGMYRLDVEPPEGAPWPRLTEDGDKAIAVGSGLTIHDVKLPPGEVVIGHIRGADAAALEGATIKIFEVLCAADTCTGASRVPPALRAQTTTGMLGEFRAVLPLLR